MFQVVIFLILTQVTCQLDTEKNNVTSIADATKHDRGEQPTTISSFDHQNGSVIVSIKPPFVTAGENSRMENMTSPDRNSTKEKSTKQDTVSDALVFQTPRDTMTPDSMITESESTQSPELTSASVESIGANSSVNVTSRIPTLELTGSVSDLTTPYYGQETSTQFTKSASEKYESEKATGTAPARDSEHSVESVNMTSQASFLNSAGSVTSAAITHDTDSSEEKPVKPPGSVDDFTNVVNMTTLAQQPDSKRPSQATRSSRVTSKIHVFSEVWTHVTPEPSVFPDTKSEGINSTEFIGVSPGFLNVTSKSNTSLDGRIEGMLSSVPKLVPVGVPVALMVALLCSLSA